MTTMRLIRWGEARAMPWKNGAGVTHEIAVHPEGAGLADFDWRISMAEVAVDGPFSRFDGIERTLCLLDGAGIRLGFDGGATEVIDPNAPPLAFLGGVGVSGRLIAGPILDLNVMTRGGTANHRVTRIAVAGRTEIEQGGITAVVCRDGALHMPGQGISMGPRDCLLLEGCLDRLELDGQSTAFVISIGVTGSRPPASSTPT